MNTHVVASIEGIIVTRLAELMHVEKPKSLMVQLQEVAEGDEILYDHSELDKIPDRRTTDLRRR